MVRKARRPGRRPRGVGAYFGDMELPTMVACSLCDWCVVIDPRELELAEQMMWSHLAITHPEAEF